jgi:hypothetical protein
MKSVSRTLAPLAILALLAAPAFAGSDDFGFQLVVPPDYLVAEEVDEKDLHQLEVTGFVLEGQSYPIDELPRFSGQGLFIVIDITTLTTGLATAFLSEDLLDEHLSRQPGTCNRAAASCAFFSGLAPGAIVVRIGCLPPNTVVNLRPIFGPAGFLFVERGCGVTAITSEAGGVCIAPAFTIGGIDNPPFVVAVPPGFNFACGGCWVP